MGRFRRAQIGLGQGDLGAAGLNDEHIFSDQLLDELHLHPILFDARVDTPDHAG